MVAQRESSVPRTSNVQSDIVALVLFSFRAIESCVGWNPFRKPRHRNRRCRHRNSKLQSDDVAFVLVSFRAIESCVVLESSWEISVS